jgi:hypothetical protein
MADSLTIGSIHGSPMSSRSTTCSGPGVPTWTTKCSKVLMSTARTASRLAASFTSPATTFFNSQSDFLTEVRNRADQEVAHITRRRSTLADDARELAYGKIALEVGRVMRLFLLKAPPERFDDGVRDKLWDALVEGSHEKADFFPSHLSVSAMTGATQAASNLRVVYPPESASNDD